ncbi:hypothetical protein [Bacillus sp. X1(2014)]|uniref:hypothetical protein n=1 Tax=Bacillus sp. X1(2014) TaxID=1565991 RepID=UPI0011AAAFAE|nr:hypothetical protein [Bacillus sp. X1(2014)]
MNIKLRYVNENREHQRTIDRVHKGKIVPVSRYINDEAVIKYCCMVCGTTFFQKPKYLLDIDNEFNHWCILKRQSKTNTSKRNQRPSTVSDELKGQMLGLHNQGVTIAEISRRLGVNRDKTKYWLNKLRGL